MITVQQQSGPGNRRHHGRWLLLLLGLAGASMASTDDFAGDQFDMDLAPFEVVELLGEATVRLVQGEENSVQATGDTGRLEISVDGGVLIIDTTKARARNDQRLMIVLNYDDLQAIRSHGDMRVLATDMALSELTLSGSGSSKFDLQNVELGRLDVHGAGAQHFQLSGAVATQAIRMIGASEFNGMDLDAVSATVIINGAGRASVASRNTLDIEILGVGNVAYRGDPEITARILGPGTVAVLEG